MSKSLQHSFRLALGIGSVAVVLYKVVEKWQYASAIETPSQTLDKTSSRTFNPSSPPSLDELKKLVSRATKTSDCPLAKTIVKNVPIYDCSTHNIANASRATALQEEWYDVLLHGPGVLVLKHMYDDLGVVDSANTAFAAVIAQEKQQSGKKGDHFSAGLSNDRIWNSFSKHCLQDPDSFLKYYSNPFLALVCEAYLGPAYRITAQVNVVKPGGAAQMCHRDYHLGFQTTDDAAKWPRAVSYTHLTLPTKRIV